MSPATQKRQFDRRVSRGIDLLLQNLQQAERIAMLESKKRLLYRYLPHSHLSTVGIDSLIAEVTSYLAVQDGSPFVSIEGPGGGGKTTLAEVVTRSYSEHVDLAGILWINPDPQLSFGNDAVAELTSESVYGLPEIVSTIINQLGHEHLRGMPLSEQLEQLAHVFQNPYLIVLDNIDLAQDISTVINALRPLAHVTRFLVTSRVSLRDLENVQIIKMPLLAKESSRKLVEITLKQKGKNATLAEPIWDSIFAAVGGNPLFLKLLSADIGDLPMEGILTAFKTASTRKWESVYDSIYRRKWINLDNAARKLWLTFLVVDPRGENGQWLLYMSGLPEASFSIALAQLVDLFLIQTTDRDGNVSYYLHPVTANFLQALVHGSKSIVWIKDAESWASFHKQQLSDSLTRSINFVKHESLQDQHQHIDSLLSILRDCRAVDPSYESVITLILALRLWPSQWGRWNIWQEELRIALKWSSRNNRLDHQAELSKCLANLLLDLGRWDDAIVMAVQAVTLARAIQSVDIFVQSSSLILTALFNQGKFAQAAEYIAEVCNAPILLSALSPQKDLATARLLIQQATLLRRQVNLPLAETKAREAIELLENIPDVETDFTAYAYRTRGLIRAAWGKYAPAVEDFTKALHLFEDKDFIASIYIHDSLGFAYLNMAAFEIAAEEFNQSINLCKNISMQWRLAYELGNLGLVYLAQGHLNEAQNCIEDHLRIARSLDAKREIGRALGNRAAVYFHQGAVELALIDLEEELAVYGAITSTEGKIPNFVYRSRCYIRLGNPDEALRLARQAHEMALSVGSIAQKIVTLRCLAECSPTNQKAAFIQEALLQAQNYRRLDEAACLLSLAELAEEKQTQDKLWGQGIRLLKRIQATGWLGGISLQHPPRILMMA